MTDLLPCPGCGALYASSDGPTHAYIGASAGCWAVFGEVLAREYSDPRQFSVHRLTVDAFAAQHPGKPSRRSIQSVAVHLIGLYLAIELKAEPEAILKSMRLLAHRDKFVWLTPQPLHYVTTVLDVRDAIEVEHDRSRVRTWAEAVWAAWSAHHQTIRNWAER